MCGAELVTGVSALAALIARQLGDEELTLLAAVLTQLGDTLTTIAVQRNLCGCSAAGNPGSKTA